MKSETERETSVQQVKRANLHADLPIKTGQGPMAGPVSVREIRLYQRDALTRMYPDTCTFSRMTGIVYCDNRVGVTDTEVRVSAES